jgi:hypothetical protein
MMMKIMKMMPIMLMVPTENSTLRIMMMTLIMTVITKMFLAVIACLFMYMHVFVVVVLRDGTRGGVGRGGGQNESGEEGR